MKLLIQFKKTAPVFLIALFCFDPVPTMQAVSPPPDACYPNYTTAEGCNALLHLGAGAGNTGVGWYSLFSAGDSNFNTGVGAGTLVLNTGDNNTAVGTAALLLNTTGERNTAVGTDALALNVSAYSNVAVGTFAAQHNDSSGNRTAHFNTAVGDFALTTNIDGSSNTAVGAGALQSVNGGNDNTVVGQFAGGSILTHSNIIAIGSSVSGVSAAFGEVDNACYIGNISGASVSLASAALVFVDADGKLGTLPMDTDGNKVTVPGLKGANPPQATSHDPRQAILNRKVEEQQATIAELKSTVAQQQKDFQATAAHQQKQIEALTAGLRRVSAQLETSRPAPQVVNNQ